MEIKSWLVLLAFLLVYIVISTDKVNKSVVALLAAAVFILTGVVPTGQVWKSIDWNTIFLLASMMMIMSVVNSTGFFQFVAIKTARLARGNPFLVMFFFCIVAALASAVLTNVATVLIMCPIVVTIAINLGLNPIPFAIALVIASDIGGVSTMSGCPTNIMVGSAAHLSFLDFLVNLGPLVLLIFCLSTFMMLLLSHKILHVSAEKRERIMRMDTSGLLTDKPLLIKAGSIIILLIVGLVFHRYLDVEASYVALAAAAVILLFAHKDEVEVHIQSIELPTMLFFVGLFILVQGMTETGWISKAASFLLNTTGGNEKYTSILLLWVSGGISSFVNNVPFAATLIPMIGDIIGHEGGNISVASPLWWALSLGVVLGGNAMLTGAAANLLASDICKRNGYPISFLRFAKYGVPVTICNLAVCTVYLILRYF
jgi:Na+/H+ antiporter NhaD/arsenite permease-like protein